MRRRRSSRKSRIREFLKGHLHVAGIEEALQNEGGQGATLVELRQ
ncbi:MAG: Smr/MutS family protein [Terracidiphilus sp.]